ncbi:BnaC04g27350D [Brassica napus]|uniref:BnaC04g27350D protein n=1 Tax=Brassica napus TaxID=3708 RepID=A0A078GWL7_BRANA|nr:BnaC04g27350D [Brassica napus]
MATSYTLLADLRVGRCSNTAKVHLLRVWEARNINKGGELMSVDMLLIDENMYELFIELTIQKKNEYIFIFL